MHHSEQKCAHFCSEWCIVGYDSDALWDLWNWSIVVTKPSPHWWHQANTSTNVDLSSNGSRGTYITKFIKSSQKYQLLKFVLILHITFSHISDGTMSSFLLKGQPWKVLEGPTSRSLGQWPQFHPANNERHWPWRTLSAIDSFTVSLHNKFACC